MCVESLGSQYGLGSTHGLATGVITTPQLEEEKEELTVPMPDESWVCGWWQPFLPLSFFPYNLFNLFILNLNKLNRVTLANKFTYDLYIALSAHYRELFHAWEM